MKLQQPDDVAEFAAELGEALIRKVSRFSELGLATAGIRAEPNPAETVRMRDPYFEFELI